VVSRPKIRFHRRPAKSSDFRRIEVLSTISESNPLDLGPMRLVSAGRGLLPCPRSGPILSHATPHVSVISRVLPERVAPLFPPPIGASP